MKTIYILIAAVLLLAFGCLGQAGNGVTGAKDPVIAQKPSVVNSSALSGSGSQNSSSTPQVAGTKNSSASASPSTVQQPVPPSPSGDVKALPTSASGTVSIPLSELSTTMKKYSYEVNGTTVRFFMVFGSDGLVRTAFDACQVCYKAKKGYSQVGNNVRCNNCGRQFSIDNLGTDNKGAGCWPSYLPNEADGTNVLVRVSDLQAGAFLFS